MAVPTLQDKLDEAVNHIRNWARIERFKYSDKKFGPHREKEIEGLQADPHCEEYLHIFNGIGDYLKRAQQFGLDSPQGRQAAGKAMITIESLLADCVVAFGPMPKPGVPSGEIHSWGV
jgi:hypothetical protein